MDMNWGYSTDPFGCTPMSNPATEASPCSTGYKPYNCVLEHYEGHFNGRLRPRGPRALAILRYDRLMGISGRGFWLGSFQQ